MKHLYVFFDKECGLCLRCSRWFHTQHQWIDLRFIPLQAEGLNERFPGIEKYDLREQLIVVDDAGGVYRGSNAWIMCLYALNEYRAWAHRLSHPALMPLARKVCEMISENRLNISGWFFLKPPEETAASVASAPEKACDGQGSCTV